MHEDLHRSTRAACEARLAELSIFRLLACQSHRLFSDEAFADLFSDIGRCSVPPRIVAVVMVLQRIHGLSDREAADAFAFDLRWKYAAGALDFDHPGFVHTVLVDMRERLRRSERPNRIFEVVLQVAKQAGMVGRKRVLDATALYDAVATQDTVTLIRSAIRGLLRQADADLEAQLRGALKRDDDYRSAGKPACDWDDEAAREALVDALARDGYAALWTLDERLPHPPQLGSWCQTPSPRRGEGWGGGRLEDDDGVFRVARRVAKDRVISTVDPQARHGHKTAARGFDGYKGHIAIDPDSEIITATDVTPGNVADGRVGASLLREVLDPPPADATDKVEIYGDSSYGTAELVEHIERAGAEAHVKVQPPSAPAGMFGKDDFRVDLDNGTVTCPAGRFAQIRRSNDQSGVASFGESCRGCPLRSSCTTSIHGRSIQIHPREATLQRTRQRQRDTVWRSRYKAHRPKVERKLAHLMFRRHGGRRARVRGRLRVSHDFALLAAAVNLKRLAVLGARGTRASTG